MQGWGSTAVTSRRFGLHFTGETIKAQRGVVTCSESHSRDLNPDLLPSESSVLTATPRTGYIVCRAQLEIKMQGPLF